MTFLKIANSRFFCLVCGILLALFASLALFSMLPEKAYAQRLSDLNTVKVDIVSKEPDGRNAVREAMNEAVTTVARERIIEVLGEANYQKNQSAIDEKIIKASNQFIPFVQSGEPQKLKSGAWKVPVELKVSSASLRKALLENGFTGSTAGAANILPLIVFTDRIHALSRRWWMPDENVMKPGEKPSAELRTLYNLEAILHARLSEEIKKQNLVFTKPSAPEALREMPANLRIERPTSNDLAAMGSYFKSAMVAHGDVRVLASNAPGAAAVSVKIQVVQVSSPDRVLAEVMREFTTDPKAGSIEAGLKAKAASEFSGLAKDLSAQVQAAWQRGTVGTNFLNLAVRGSLSPAEQVAFKSEFVRNVREAHDLKERMFERDIVTYEVDFSGDANQFANRLKAVKLAGFDVKIPDGQSGSRSMTIDVRSIAGQPR